MSNRQATRVNTFGEFVVSRRALFCMTQTELSEKLGIARPVVCDVEKGRRLPELARAPRWAKALRTPVERVVELLLKQLIDEAGVKVDINVWQK